MIGDGDIESIFENGDWNVTASFATSPTATVVQGWFSKPTEEIRVGGEILVEAIAPSFKCPRSRVIGIRKGVSVTISGTTYTVERRHDTGIGVIEFYLKT